MVKAKEFWEYLCNELNYRFFAGMACAGLKPLYDKMNIKFMHYIPSVRSSISLGLVSGAFLSGFKGGVLIDVSELYDMLNGIKTFVSEYKIPFLIIVYDNGNANSVLSSYKIPYFTLNDNFKTVLKKAVNKSEKKLIPCAITIGEGVLK